jgi:hypothetical protein
LRLPLLDALACFQEEEQNMIKSKSSFLLLPVLMAPLLAVQGIGQTPPSPPPVTLAQLQALKTQTADALAKTAAAQAAAAAADASVQALINQLTPPPPVQRTLSKSDLTYLGKFLTTVNARSNGAIGLRRKPDGTKSLLVMGQDTGQNPLHEVTLPGFSTTAPPTAALLNTWTPAQWQQGCLTWNPIPPASGGLQVGGCVMLGNVLYTVFGGHYDVSGGDKPVLMTTTFNADGTLTSAGPWFTASSNKWCRSWAMTDPRKGLYLGGGITAGDGSSPWGRSLVSLPVPATFPAVNAVLPSTVWLGYPIGNPDVYPGTHVTSATQPTPVAGGPWINQGVVTTACWVETPTVIGVVYTGHYGDGYTWYGLNPDPVSGNVDTVNVSKGYHATEYHGYLSIDNPAKYAAVASGSVPSWTPHADSVFDPFPMMVSIQTIPNQPTTGTQQPLAGGNAFTGSVFDPDTSTLYLSGTWEGTGQLGIHAFKVAQ